MLNKQYHIELVLSSFKVTSKEEALSRTKSGELFATAIQREVSFNDMVKAIAKGHIVIPSSFSGGFKKKNWEASDLIFIDVDDSNHEDFDFLPSHLKPTLVYTTLSHSDENKRYRLVYLLNETQDDLNEYEALIRGLIVALEAYGVVADKQCANGNRVYYPAQSIISIEENILDVNVIEPINQEFTQQLKFDGFVIENPVAKAIQDRDYTKLKDMVKVTLPDNFDNLELIDKLNSINISEFFNIPTDRNISCLFHDDENPSANVMAKESNEMYKCFSCGKTHNLVTLIGDLMDSTNNEAIKLIEKVLGVKVTSQYQENMLRTKFFHMRDVDKLEETHPELYKWMKASLLPFYRAIVDIGMNRCSNTPIVNEKQLSFFISQRELSKVLKTYGIKNISDRGELSKKINNLVRVGLLVKEDENIKKSFKDRAEDYRKNQGYRYRTQFYSIPMSSEIFSLVQTEYLKQKEAGILNGYPTSRALSLYDTEVAQSTFIQTNIEYVQSKIADDRDYILSLVKSLVEEYGYAHDNMIVQSLREVGIGKKRAEDLVKEHRVDCVNHFDFIYVNKETKEEYNLPDEVKFRSKVYAIKN